MLEKDQSFTEQLNILRKGNTNKAVTSKGIKEVFFLREDQSPITSFYLKHLEIPKKGFVYYEGMSFNKISNLKLNLLNEMYWVLGNHGSKGGIEPMSNMKFNDEVLKDLLNHIIITSNWGMFSRINKDTWTIPIQFGEEIYDYSVRFVGGMPNEVIEDFIETRLGEYYEPTELSRIKSLINSDKKNVVKWVRAFESMKRFTYEEVVETVEKEKGTYIEIGKVVRALTTKDQHWEHKKVIKSLVENKGIAYTLTSIKNGVEDMWKLKQGRSWNKITNGKYMNSYKKEVDSLDLLILRNILECKLPGEVLILLEVYMTTNTTKMIIGGGRKYGRT